ncbi:MAG TPA: FumA C-terminus/TtdB family hydratase beta subunit [Chloroflexota bacterium]|nr:FumA C-terminus/TtdB family hydratase beta subunit [Chloroflexota bacterium]
MSQPPAPPPPVSPEAPIPLTLPLTAEVRLTLRAGQRVLLSGPIYGARDAAHARLFDLIRAGRAADLPLDLRHGAVYYVGPAPAPEGPQGHVVGSAGPTTSTRMDAYTPLLIEHGLRLMVGKGRRGAEVKAAMLRHGAVYLAATGGAGALLARQIVASRVVAYADLGPEAIHLLQLRDFPAIVAVDSTGADLYDLGPAAYARPLPPRPASL